MYVFYVPWTAAVLILHICSVKYTTERAEKLLKEPYTPLPDIMQEILPILEHNQKTFINMGNKKTKKIKLLENLYD